MKERLLSTVKKYALVLLIGLAYLAWVLLTGLKIPCVFKLITGLNCPGCGVTRMVVAAVRLNFSKAFWLNPYLFTNLPVILFCLVYSDIRYIQTGERALGFTKWILWCEIALALIFGVVRNVL